ncbi:hypothetical protein Misp05_44970 [Micromonospora sp. NBRC 107095]|nr:hypothetical protein Misp05_44970 [Micromonospora sp. NBRC 107095]
MGQAGMGPQQPDLVLVEDRAGTFDQRVEFGGEIPGWPVIGRGRLPIESHADVRPRTGAQPGVGIIDQP